MNNGDVHALKFLEQKFKQSKIGDGGELPELKELITGFARVNSFITLYDFGKQQYVFHHNMTEHTGYTPEEFTIDAIRNSPLCPIKIVHPDDIKHKSRHEMVMLQMATENVQIKPLSEHTDTRFRIIKKNKDIIKVNRQTFLFQTDSNGLPVSIIEIWKIIPITDDYVTIVLFSEDPKLYDIFYKLNAKLVGFYITDRHKEIISLRNKRFDNNQIATKLNISTKTVQNHIRIIKQNIQEYYNNNNIHEPLNNMADIIYFIKKFTLFSL